MRAQFGIGALAALVLVASGCSQLFGPQRMKVTQRVTESGVIGGAPSSTLTEEVEYDERDRVTLLSRRQNGEDVVSLDYLWSGDELSQIRYETSEVTLTYLAAYDLGGKLDSLRFADGAISHEIDVFVSENDTVFEVDSAFEAATSSQLSTVEYERRGGELDGDVIGVTTRRTTIQNGVESWFDVFETVTHANGHPTRDDLELEDSTGARVTTSAEYRYDLDARLESVSSDFYGETLVEYDLDGNVSSIETELPNGTFQRTTFQYDEGRTRQLIWQMQGFPLSALFDLKGKVHGPVRQYSSSILVF